MCFFGDKSSAPEARSGVHGQGDWPPHRQPLPRSHPCALVGIEVMWCWFCIYFVASGSTDSGAKAMERSFTWGNIAAGFGSIVKAADS